MHAVGGENPGRRRGGVIKAIHFAALTAGADKQSAATVNEKREEVDVVAEVVRGCDVLAVYAQKYSLWASGGVDDPVGGLSQCMHGADPRIGFQDGSNRPRQLQITQVARDDRVHLSGGKIGFAGVLPI